MTHMVNTVECSGAARHGDEAVPVATRLQWENYLRCLFLAVIVLTVGYMAWRPSMLRLSTLRMYVSPSHGDSLAWKPSTVDAISTHQAVRTLPPAEWRLSSSVSTGWNATRPPVDRYLVWRGAGMSRPRWRRTPHSSWDWRDSVAFGSKRKDLALIVPPQKPASSYRSGPAWNGAQPNGTLAAITPPAASVTLPLAMPEHIAPPRAQTVPATEAPQSVDAAVETTEPSALNRPVLRLPPLAAARPAEPLLPVPAREPLTPEPEPLQAMVQPAATHGPRQRENAAVSLARAAGGPDTVQPTALKQQPAQQPAETAPPARPNPAPPTTGGWANREITGPIPGAYLTIYPKLRFVGLCVPGENYIRKYNQVAVPRDSAGDKHNSLDGKTPYGKYYIAGHRRDAAGARLILSWPSPDDARRIGLGAAEIAAIENAWLIQGLPPQDTVAGGGVYLTGLRSQTEATEGSFALEEPHLEEIFTALPDGAWVFIQE